MYMQCSNNYNIIKFLNELLLKENLNCVIYSTFHFGRQVKNNQFMRCIMYCRSNFDIEQLENNQDLLFLHMLTVCLHYIAIIIINRVLGCIYNYGIGRLYPLYSYTLLKS